MVNWHITATTIYCEDMDYEVTIMVYKDGRTKCTGYDISSKQEAKPSGKKEKNKPECSGPECRCVKEYRDKLLSEETKK
ncbi:MAG: hypothetical protein PHE15_03280 [Dehalococcoidales bacterium]|nr:hypothetical protein [Dehalococcoidales bacterium]